MSTVVLRPPLTCVHTSVTPALRPWLGGKGANLARLERWGYPVPPWYGVTTAAFERCLARQGLDGEIARRLEGLDGKDLQGIERAAGEIQDRIAALELPEEVVSELRSAHREAIPDGERVAVRSSAVDEDSGGASFAGVHESVLGVEDVEGVVAALRRVWASAFRSEALSYRLARGLATTEIAMGVVVQRMVDARVSGVAFTCHPATGDPLEVVVSSLYGLGPGVVDGELPADRYVVDKRSLTVRSELARKVRAFETNGHGGGGRLHAVPVPAELPDRSSLSEEEVLDLTRAALAIERRMGRPQDIEFAVDGTGELRLLQTRPVATARTYGPAAGRRRVWNAGGSNELYPGINLPMTYSVARRFRRVGYHWLTSVAKLSSQELMEVQSLFDSSIGYVQGRLCTNRTDRALYFRLIPGSGFAPRPFLRLLSVRDDEMDPDLELADPSFARRWLVELPRLLRLVGGLAWRTLWTRDRDADSLADTKSLSHRCRAMDFSELRPDELIDLYHHAERELTANWKAPMLSRLQLRITYVALVRCCRAWCGDRDGTLAGQLMRGDRASESAEPAQRLMELAARARDEPELHSLLTERSPDEVLRALRRDDRFRRFTAEVESYLDRFGHLSFTEMKLEAPTLGERPDLLIGMLQTHLATGKKSEGPAGGQAESRALDAIGGSVLGYPRRLVFRWLVKAVQRLDRRREAAKTTRVRLMDVFRRIIRALGDELARESVIDHPQDIFYLTLDEVFDYVRGNAVTVDLSGLVALRRRQVEGWKEAPSLLERFESHGAVYHGNALHAAAPDEAPEGADLLRGTACCRGTITGPVRKMRSLDEPVRLRDEILVLDSIHTGWIPFLPLVSGLLVERGGVLSHTANVARELGIPTVVNIPGLMQSVEDGDLVTIDGEKGTIERVEPGAPSATGVAAPGAA